MVSAWGAAQLSLQLAFEPTPAAYGEMWRLGDLGNSQHVLVKRPGFILTPGRHCKLNMVYVTDLHFLHSAWIVCSLTIHPAPSNVVSSRVSPPLPSTRSDYQRDHQHKADHTPPGAGLSIHGIPRVAGPRQFPQTLHDEGGMGLPSRHKILLHAQMNFQRLPTRAPSCKTIPVGGKAGDFLERCTATEQLAVQQAATQRSGLV
jgi:hypothetical protein